MKQMKDIVEDLGCKISQVQYWAKIVPELQRPREQGKVTWYSIEDMRVFRLMKVLTDLGFPPSLAAKLIHKEAWENMIKVIDSLMAK